MAWITSLLIMSTTLGFWTLINGAGATHLRLVAGKCASQGRLEILIGSWGTINNNTFSDYSARIACRQLGYGYGLKIAGPQGSYRRMLTAVKCTKAEAEASGTNLRKCANVLFRSSSRIHTNDVAVQCYSNTSSFDCDGKPYPSNLDMRLAKPACASTGQVMMFHDHAWHDFCLNDLIRQPALTKTLCSVLGHADGLASRTSQLAGFGVSFVTDYSCRNNITRDCTTKLGNCSSYFGMDIQCFNEEGRDCKGHPFVSEGGLRLQDGRCASEGRLEIAHNTLWGTIKSSGFTNYSAQVACRQMGYETGYKRRGKIIVRPRIWLDMLKCYGGCSSWLLNCTRSPWTTAHTTMGTYVAEIVCYNFTHFQDCSGRPYAEEGALALVGGNSSAGRLEIFHANRWGTICDDEFTNIAASMACRQLGYLRGLIGPSSLAGNGYGTTWLDNVVCTKEHYTIASCSHHSWGREDCEHSEDVRIRCSNELECFSNPCRNGAPCENTFMRYTCVCPSGFSGVNCEVDVNECEQEQQCFNDGTCIDAPNDYICLCSPGYQGKNCSLETDECESSPCLHGGTCVDRLSSYACTCSLGYKGAYCDVDVNECIAMPCHNGGLCEDGVNDFSCRCPDGFGGKRCDINIDECACNPCQNNATCLDGNNWFFCRCLPGYHGHHCEISAFVDECASSPCRNNGTCIDGDNWYACKCLDGYSGSDCHISPFTDECASNPCKNNGTCFDGNGWYVCKCTKAFSGHDCQISEGADECLSSPCQNGGTCLDGNSWYVCKCPPGISGHNCQITQGSDVCASSPCLNGGSCLAGDDWYVCKCLSGFIGDTCESPQEVDWCASGPCQNNGTCYDGASWYVCKCPYGVSGEQCQHLEDVNWCASNPCRNGASCLDGKNWFVCKCPSGYTGILCQTHQLPGSCDSNPCRNNGSCLAGNGWYVCKCVSDYTGNNCNLYNDHEDRCISNPCLNNGTCYGGEKWFFCQCPSGYAGKQCQTKSDTDKCASGPCQNGGTCLNSNGGFKCTCVIGYLGDRCQVSDTAAVNGCDSNPCRNQGTCYKVSVGYLCRCPHGVSGQNCEVSQVPSEPTLAAAATEGPRGMGTAGPGNLSLWFVIGFISICSIIFMTYLVVRWRRHRYLSKGRPRVQIPMSVEFSSISPADEDDTSLRGSRVPLAE